jgi:hypothetical protein
VIEATLAGGVVVDGEDGSDAVSVNLGSLDGAVAVDDSGSEGVDTLTVHGTPEADSLTVSDAQVARIDETISFGAGIEGLMVHGGAGDDDISVAVVDPAFSATLTVEGEDGNDSIDASATTATITIGGGGGRDVLTGGTGQWSDARGPRVSTGWHLHVHAGYGLQWSRHVHVSSKERSK